MSEAHTPGNEVAAGDGALVAYASTRALTRPVPSRVSSRLIGDGPPLR